MRFLHGAALNEAISSILAENSIRCAVAFWGKGADALITGRKRQQIHLICNLMSGATNPHVIRKLQESGAEVRQADILHAKVYIGRDHAVVASANASANGLGLEGSEQRHWIEAGVEFTDTASVIDWFEQLWTDSRPITAADLAKATASWKPRRAARPTVSSFADFDFEADPLILICPVDYREWEPREEAIKASIGYYDDSVHELIENGLEVDRADAALFNVGRWVLCWWPTAKGRPNRRRKPYWLFTQSPLIEDAFVYRDDRKKKQDVVLKAATSPPPPFELGDGWFEEVFGRVMALPKYHRLNDGETGPWFAERQEVTREFWRELQRSYRARPE
jgi:hypothetical protein